jgi:hypothetical protein
MFEPEIALDDATAQDVAEERNERVAGLGPHEQVDARAE